MGLGPHSMGLPDSRVYLQCRMGGIHEPPIQRTGLRDGCGGIIGWWRGWDMDARESPMNNGADGFPEGRVELLTVYLPFFRCDIVRIESCGM